MFTVLSFFIRLISEVQEVFGLDEYELTYKSIREKWNKCYLEARTSEELIAIRSREIQAKLREEIDTKEEYFKTCERLLADKDAKIAELEDKIKVSDTKCALERKQESLEKEIIDRDASILTLNGLVTQLEADKKEAIRHRNKAADMYNESRRQILEILNAVSG